MINRSFLLFSLLVAFTASAGFAAEAEKSSAVVAQIGDTTLTQEDMAKDLASQIYDLETQIYQMKNAWVDQKAKEIVFDSAAKAAKLPRAQWETQQVEAQVKDPTSAEVADLLKGYPPEVAASSESVRQVKQYLKMQKRQARENELYSQLKAQYPVKIFLARPVAPHIAVSYSPQDPVLGSAKAPVTILEFTDFQCPFCKRSQDTLHEVEKAYAGKIKLVARQFPLQMHDRAHPASEAALCAQEQGAFWPMREKMFEKQQLQDADFIRYVKELKLNEKKFAQCYKEGRYKARIDKDIADGQSYGVRGTPHFFVNGVPINGAQPFSAFQTVIDDELAKAK